MAKGITVYRVQAVQADATRIFFNELVADVGLLPSDGVETFHRDMVRGIGRTNKEFLVDYDTGTVFGAKICTENAAGDPSGLIAVLSAEQDVYLVLYGGSFVHARARGTMAPLRSRCVFVKPAV